MSARLVIMQTFSEVLASRIEEASKGVAYHAYKEMRDRVLLMMGEALEHADAPSKYWQEEIEGFDYMFDASPLIVAKLREHCYHITGLRSYEYRQHHAHAAQAFATKLQALRACDPRGLFIPEARELGGFGHEVQGQLVNMDTLKFYESLIAMERSGLLAELRLQRRVVVEIGGGWGGFAYQIKKLIPDTTYVIVDLPPTLLFSGTYLMALFPHANFFIYGRDPIQNLKERILDYDFIFLPHYVFSTVELQRVDLAINMVSFQEMTTEQVAAYLKRLTELGCSVLYSHNRDRSKHNSQLTAVGVLLKRHFQLLEEIEVLPVSYTTLALPSKLPPLRIPRTLNPYAFAREMMRSLVNVMTANTPRKYSPMNYRHLVGRNFVARSFLDAENERIQANRFETGAIA